MKKREFNTFWKIIIVITYAISKASANSASVFFMHQPNIPKAVTELRDF